MVLFPILLFHVIPHVVFAICTSNEHRIIATETSTKPIMMSSSSSFLFAIWVVLSTFLLVPPAVRAETSCPPPPDTSSTCQTVTSWTHLIAAVTSNYNGRVVLCSFTVTPSSAFIVREPVDVLCEDGGVCEITGGSSYHVDIRSDHVRWMGFSFSAATTSAIVSRNFHTAVCDCRFESNQRPSSSGAAIVQMTGDLTVSNSVFVGNVAKNGGAIYNKGALIVLDSVFMQNEAMYGGAIKTSGGSLEVARSTFTDNLSYKSGPALVFYSSSGTMSDAGENTGSGNIAALNGVECNGFYASGTCSDFLGEEEPPLTPTVTQYDVHGSLLAYQYCASCSPTQDWASAWDAYDITIDSAFETDPYDPRATMRGSGNITTDSTTGVAVFSKSPRFYIDQSEGDQGWENVEFTTYGMYVNDPFTRPYSGLTLAARSNHADYKDNGCNAPTYYAKIYRDSGNLAFIKEYYHDGESNESVYANSIQVPFFEGGLPFLTWIGMKFVVLTVPGTENVLLQLYIDLTDGGANDGALTVTSPGSSVVST
jgi:hypothetical protein